MSLTNKTGDYTAYCISISDNEVARVYPMYRGDMIIPQNGLMMPNDRNVPLSTTEAEAFEVRFPKLSIKQRKFAVNPGYMSYYNPDFEVIEDERDLFGRRFCCALFGYNDNSFVSFKIISELSIRM